MATITKTKYEIGDVINYTNSVPLSQRDIIAEGQELDRIYIVTLEAAGTATVKWWYPAGSIFNYDEEIPNNHHVIQAIKSTKNNKMSFRLITGNTPVYGRVIFKSSKNTRIINVRSIAQYDRYQNAVNIITETSPGPHRLISKEPMPDGVLYNFRTIAGQDRSIEFVKEKSSRKTTSK